MILVEKDVAQIILICMASQKEQVIVDIVEMAVENHPSHKRRIEHSGITADADETHRVSYGVVRRNEGTGQRDQYERE